MPFYERDDVRIYFEEVGSGFPILLIAGGGLNSSVRTWAGADIMSAPFDAITEFSGEFRCVAMDQRHSPIGQSSGPMELEHPWEAYAQDQLGLMEHLGADRFLVLGSCIAGPFIFKLMEMAPERIAGAVICQPSGASPEFPDFFYTHASSSWVPAICDKQPGVTPEMAVRHLDRLYHPNPDFVFSVTRDFARSCQTPVLVLPDDIHAHPWQISMDIFKLVPNAQVSIYPWKTPERVPQVVEQVRAFLRANDPTAAPTP